MVFILAFKIHIFLVFISFTNLTPMPFGLNGISFFPDVMNRWSFSPMIIIRTLIVEH